jgi:hypothetical protein
VIETWKSQTALLCQRDQAERLAGKFPSTTVFTVEDPGFLNLRTMGDDTLSAIQLWQPDMAVIVTGAVVYDGYGNVLEIAKASGAKRVVFVNAAGMLKQV